MHYAMHYAMHYVMHYVMHHVMQVPILDDDVAEEKETFTVLLEAPDTGQARHMPHAACNMHRHM